MKPGEEPGVSALIANAKMDAAKAEMMAAVNGLQQQLNIVQARCDAISVDYAKLKEAFAKRTEEHDAAVRHGDELQKELEELRRRYTDALSQIPKDKEKKPK